MAWGNEAQITGTGFPTGTTSILGNVKVTDDRPELVVVDEMLSKALMTLDEELRLISNSISSLGGPWPTNGATAPILPPAVGNVVSTLRDRADAAQRCAALAHDLRERLQRIV